MVKREEILDYLRKVNCPEDKIEHSVQVADLALKIAGEFNNRGYNVNLDLVELGALLHDIGISITKNDTSPEHCVLGADLARRDGFSDQVANCIERHEMCGLTKEEAKLLRFPEPLKDTYLPEALEEKIVAYADLLVFIVIESGNDPWKDPEAPSKTLYPYLDECYRKKTSQAFDKDNNILGNVLKRADDLNREMIGFVKKEFIK